MENLPERPDGPSEAAAKPMGRPDAAGPDRPLPEREEGAAASGQSVPSQPAEDSGGRGRPDRPDPTAAGRSPRSPWSRLWWIVPLLGILLIGAAFRFTNLGWDEGLALHPDERFLTMVEQAIAFPESCQPFLSSPSTDTPTGTETSSLGQCLHDYLDTANSPLNPRNRGHGLFVYGSLPIFTLRAIIEARGILDFGQVTLAGRALSAVVDLLTLLLTFFLAKRLYGVRAGLLAALFLAMSVFNIQSAHFFTVDTFTALTTLLCVYLAVVIAEGKGSWGTYALMGLAFGAAVASKVNTASFVLIIGLAALLRVWRLVEEEGEEAWGPILRRTTLGLALAGMLALGTFRLAQPYAFHGPGPFDLGQVPEDPNKASVERLLETIFEKRYLDNMRTVQGLVSGEVDYYPSHQWTGRTALWFPWKNMVLWGLGLPLGLAGWAGVALAGWQLLRRRDLRHAAPLAWTLFLFAYLGIQFVKTMRYFLPIYPLLCMFAAHLLLWLWRRARQYEPRPRWRTVAAGALLALVTLGTLVWALGFMQIYLQPVTRATASRWIYEHISTADGAHLELQDGRRIPIDIPNAQLYKANDPVSVTPFVPDRSGTAIGLGIAHLQDPAQNETTEILAVSLTADREGQQVLAEGQIRGNFAGPAGDGAPGYATFTPIEVQAGRTYYLRLRGLHGSLRTWAVALANEQWDDPLPKNIDGRDSFGYTYRGLDLAPYGEDTPQKVRDMLHQIANTDYVILSSNRLYDSIPRLPMRYPVTTRYYEALFDGSLGFERVATFSSYITLFDWADPPGLPMSDEEKAAADLGWSGLPIPDRCADEAFSVYDHPQVIILRRTERFDREQAYEMLTEGIDWDEIARIKPIEVPDYRSLMLTDQEWETQRQGGTWSDLFDRDGWSNRLSVLVWLLLAELLGLAAFPLANLLLGRLADGGYLAAKALGMLLLGYGAWLLAATKLLPYSRGTIALVLGLLVLLGGLAAWRRRDELKTLVQSRYRLLLLGEAVFLAGFVLFLLIRLGNPDLWHPWYGGEKPMDLAYLNAIIRSSTFPPYDPWFAGGYLNYYYFSHVLTATLIKLTGIVPSVAYNLALPLYYGLTCGGVFTVVYHLANRRREKEGWDPRAIYAALAGVALVALLGNLGQYMMLLKGLIKASGLDFESSIPGLAGLVKGVGGLFKVIRGQAELGIGQGTWYWRASRVIQEITARTVHGNEINEFPFFTFLYADLHPHMVALPLTLLIPTQIVALVRERRPDRQGFLALLPRTGVLLGMGLILGALRCAHFWDFPTYLLVALGGWAVVLYQRRRRIDWQTAAGVVMLAVLLLLLASILYRPFWARYGSFYDQVIAWEGERTRVGEYLIMHGLLLFILASYLLIKTLGRGTRESPLRLAGMFLRYWDRLPTLTRRLSRWGKRPLRQRYILWGGAILGLVALFLLLPAPAATEGAPAAEVGLFARLRQQHLLGWLVLLAGLGLVLFFRRRARGEDRIVALFVLAGLGLTGGVELLTVKGDIARQNTFFRFYFQTWVLWGIAAAAALPYLWQRLRRWARPGRQIWQAAFYVLVGLCALYPLLATPAKMSDRFPDSDLGPGLDGAAFMQQAVYHDPQGSPITLAEDAAAIRWLQDNVEGSPVVMEGNALLYRWGNRISIHTGLPTIIGWDWHQKQQRGFLGPIVESRLSDLSTLYGSTDQEQTLRLLREYKVAYIVVGQLERNYYAAEGLAKLERMVGVYLEQVYPEPSAAAPGAHLLAAPAGGAPGQPRPTAAPYPPVSPPTSGTAAYPGRPPAEPTSISPTQDTPTAEGSKPADANQGTVIYRVLPAVWGE
ncbi:MAG: glycosyltransferase family 39 protein [Chloroflexia bacterium]|nr:glycosyltransferase family 39 protein [Chloroflexia bacterium]